MILNNILLQNVSAHREALDKNVRRNGDLLDDVAVCVYMHLTNEFGYLFKIAIAND